MARLGDLYFNRYSEYSNVIELPDGSVSLTDKDMAFIVENWRIAKDIEAGEESRAKDIEAVRRWIEGEPTPTNNSDRVKAVQS